MTSYFILRMLELLNINLNNWNVEFQIKSHVVESVSHFLSLFLNSYSSKIKIVTNGPFFAQINLKNKRISWNLLNFPIWTMLFLIMFFPPLLFWFKLACMLNEPAVPFPWLSMEVHYFSNSVGLGLVPIIWDICSFASYKTSYELKIWNANLQGY